MSDQGWLGLGSLLSPWSGTGWPAGGLGPEEEAQAKAGAAQDLDMGLAWVSLSCPVPAPSSLEEGLLSAAGIY